MVSVFDFNIDLNNVIFGCILMRFFRLEDFFNCGLVFWFFIFFFVI